MPAGGLSADGKGKGKSKQGWGGNNKNLSWTRPQGNDSTNRQESTSVGSPEVEEEEEVARQQKIESDAKELKAKLLSSSMCKKPNEDCVEIIDGPDPTPAQSTRSKPPVDSPLLGSAIPPPSPTGNQEFDQKLVARQERFGRDADGAHAKSSIAIKRSSSSGSIGPTLSTPNVPAPTSEASTSVQPRSPFAPPPPVNPTVSTASAVVGKSSDGARTKAGSSSMQAPGKPRGSAGMTPTPGVLIQSPPPPVDTIVQAVKTTPMAAESASIETPSQIVALPEHTSAKATFDALTVPTQSACLKRALDAFPEAARKRPRLVAGESSEWEVEYKSLVDWLDKNLPSERYHAKIGAPFVTCTSERLADLERCWQQLV